MELFNLNEFSLWLEPKSQSYLQIDNVIKSICGEVGAIPFVPHVTLLADIPYSTEIQRYMENIAKTTAPFEITFQKVSVGEHYLKCLFCECKENPALMEFNRVAQKVYSLDRSYSPHMSFVYGEFVREQKEKLAEKLEKQVSLFSFKATTLSLWHATKTPDHWVRLAETVLSGEKQKDPHQ